MDKAGIGAVISSVVAVGYAVSWAWRGFNRRRDHWSRASWIGLTIAVLVGLALVIWSFLFSAAVDNHAAWVGVRGSLTRVSWVLLALIGLVGGTGLFAGSLAWFAYGDSRKPFPLFGSRSSARSADTHEPVATPSA